MARAFNKVARLRQAAQKWHFEKYVEEMMDSLTGEEFDAFFPTEEALRTLPIGPRINGFRCSVGRHVCGSSNPVAEVRGTSCGAEMEVSGS